MIVGPGDDPARVRGGGEAPRGLAQIAAGSAAFVSRGDESGTHKAEIRLWRAAHVDPQAASGTWYRETGSGMGATLNTAAAMGAYALVDRGSWLAFKNRRSLEVVLEGDARLFNPYGVILVNPARHPHVKQALGQRFIDWIRSEDGQQAIGSFRVAGERLFHPNAGPSAAGSAPSSDALGER